METVKGPLRWKENAKPFGPQQYSFPCEPADRFEFMIYATDFGLVIHLLRDEKDELSIGRCFSGKALDKLAELVTEAQTKRRRFAQR